MSLEGLEPNRLWLPSSSPMAVNMYGCRLVDSARFKGTTNTLVYICTAVKGDGIREMTFYETYSNLQISNPLSGSRPCGSAPPFDS